MRQLEPTMTKADQVRALLKAGKTSREIADEVGCHDAYVRVIIQRDAGVDHAGEYRKRVFTKAMASPEIVAEARRCGREAYQVARASGLTFEKSRMHYSHAHNKARLSAAAKRSSAV